MDDEDYEFLVISHVPNKYETEGARISFYFQPWPSRLIHLRMHRVPVRRLLKRERHPQWRGFVVQAAREHDRPRQARRSGKATGNANRRMTGQVCDDQAAAAGRG